MNNDFDDEVEEEGQGSDEGWDEGEGDDEDGYGDENESDFVNDVEETDEPVIFDYDKSSSLGETLMLQKTVNLVSAHKLAIAEMVEVSPSLHCSLHLPNLVLLPSSGDERRDGACADHGADHRAGLLFLCPANGPDLGSKVGVDQRSQSGAEVFSEISHRGPL
jgi:hypothetical protein